ncbi:MAG: beta-propeller fold lactonase family protein [Spirochaetes bacterium]|nr:beta-propeller fold lactonase family protein [Spirochaetota bacterium]
MASQHYRLYYSLAVFILLLSSCHSWGKFWELPLAGISPVDGATQVKLNTPITTTFPAAVDTATLFTGSSNVCSGSFQLSADNFASCLTMFSPTPTAAAGNTVFTFRPLPLPLANTAYTLRINEDVKFSGGGSSQAYRVTFTTADVGKFFFVNNWNNDNIGSYTIDRQNGTLALTGTHSMGNQCYDFQVDGTGHYILYSSHATNQTFMPIIDATNGTLTDNTPPAVTLTNTSSIAFHPSNAYVYILNDVAASINKFNFSEATGLISSQNSLPISGSATTLILNHQGTALYTLKSSSNTLYSFSIDTAGNVLATGNITVGTNPVGLTISGDDRFIYVVNQSTNIAQFQLNSDGTVGANLGSWATCGDGGAEIDPSGRFLYASCSSGNGVDQFSINASSGNLMSIGLASIAGANGCSTVVVDPGGRFAYCTNHTTNNISPFKIDPVTGYLTQNGALVATGNGPSAAAIY